MTYLNDKFDDLPILQAKPVMSDDDIEFASDMDYMKRLLTEIIEQAARGGRRSPFPEHLSYELAWLEGQVKDV